ncbi:MAG TPA: DUF3037 domain-containing protein, partial [Candidatus Acidoferrum sp.]|nr:DUF3037 domain-containing protein [Candidatus Acidoferrum sp.]
MPERQDEPAFAYRVLRYMPNLLRDEYVNIGVLVFDPVTGDRRLRIIEEPNEFARVRRLHPGADVELLLGLPNHLESRFSGASELSLADDLTQDRAGGTAWLKELDILDATSSNTLQFGPQKAVYAPDLDTVVDSLYGTHVAVEQAARGGASSFRRNGLRTYCSKVLEQVGMLKLMEKRVPAAEFTFAGDPTKIDYGYHRNGTRGFLQTISLSPTPGDVKSFAYTVHRIREKVHSSEFTAVT